MSSVSRPVADLGSESAEKGTVPHLILLLKSAFRPVDFDKVEQILITREDDLQREIRNCRREIGNWRNEFELMEKKQGEMTLAKLEVEDELNKYKRECGVLKEQVNRLEKELRVQIARSEEDQRVQITRSKEDKRFHCDREKTWEERYAKLLEDYTKIETESKKLNLRNSAFEIAKNKAERELQASRKRFEELNLRVSRLEDDTRMLMSGGPMVLERKEDLVADELIAGNKNYESGKSQCEASFGTGDGNLAHPQAKESTSNRNEEVHSVGGAGVASASNSMEAASNLQEAGPHSVMALDNGKHIRNQLAVERGSGTIGSSDVIEIIDSDDEEPRRDASTSMPNHAAKGEEIKTEHFSPTGDENGRSCGENCLLASCTKRKRGSIYNIYEGKKEDDRDEIRANPSKHQTKSLHELIMDGIDCSESSDSGDSSSSDSDILHDSNMEREIAMLKRKKGERETWDFEADLISDFGKDPELCMNAVCALYRQQSQKVKSESGCRLSKNRGFGQSDALRGNSLAKYLTDGDPQGKLKRSVSELQQFDSNGLADCKKLAFRYSNQLFEIYKKKEDPFFLPS